MNEHRNDSLRWPGLTPHDPGIRIVSRLPAEQSVRRVEAVTLELTFSTPIFPDGFNPPPPSSLPDSRLHSSSKVFMLEYLNFLDRQLVVFSNQQDISDLVLGTGAMMWWPFVGSGLLNVGRPPLLPVLLVNATKALERRPAPAIKLATSWPASSLALSNGSFQRFHGRGGGGALPGYRAKKRG